MTDSAKDDPIISVRTPLFPLVPIGPGTPLVEALTGYISRIAAEHGLLISDFLDIPCIMSANAANQDQRTRRRMFHASCYQIDGSISQSGFWISILEKAAGARDLRLHTILPFEKLSADSWLRAWKAWCPECYEAWLESGALLYDPLLWCIKAVRVCPIHLSALVEVCPSCGKRFRLLTNGYSVGRCGRCHSWLGRSRKIQQVRRPGVCDPCSIWSANQIGILLGAIPSLTLVLERSPLQTAIRTLCDSIPFGDQEAVFKVLGITQRSIRTWSNGHVLPRLGSLCRLAFHLQVSLLDLILGKVSAKDLEVTIRRLLDESAAELLQLKNGVGGYPMKLSYVETLEAVRQAATEVPPPTLQSVAVRLGFAGASTLVRRHAANCELLRQRRRAWLADKLRKLQTMLEGALREEKARSVKQVCRDFGVREELVSKYFPDLTRQLRVRYMQWISAERLRKQSRFESAVLRAVRQLQKGREYPSVGRVLSIDPTLRSAGWERLTSAIRKSLDILAR